MSRKREEDIMTIQLAITLNPKHPDFAAMMGTLTQALSGSSAAQVEATTVDEAVAAKKTRTRKESAPVEAKEEEVMEPKTEESDSFDLGSSDEEEEETAKEPTITKSDMLRVLKAHPSKEKVTKLLQTRFKVKNINELKETQYAEVVAAVEKLK
jgi:hypothetical protein